MWGTVTATGSCGIAGGAAGAAVGGAGGAVIGGGAGGGACYAASRVVCHKVIKPLTCAVPAGCNRHEQRCENVPCVIKTTPKNQYDSQRSDR